MNTEYSVFQGAEFVANRTGEIEREIPPLLVEQLTHPVQWARALATVRENADVVVTIGPGGVIRALWHRCFGRENGTRLLATEDERGAGETIACLRGSE